MGAFPATATSGASLDGATLPVLARDIDADPRLSPNDAGADQVAINLRAVVVGNTIQLVTAKATAPASGSGTSGNGQGQPKAPAGKARSGSGGVGTVATPPAGSSAKVVQAGPADAAGNARVVQVYGGQSVNGVPLQGSAQTGASGQPAPMPGGVAGGGHFSHQIVRHLPTQPISHAGSDASGWRWIVGLVGILLVAVALVSRRYGPSNRRRLHRTSSRSTRRTLANAGKGVAS
jgi:hypothetical protein